MSTMLWNGTQSTCFNRCPGHFFKEDKFFGGLLEKEVNAIEKIMNTGEKPVLAILGGAKVSSKITIIENMLDKIDHLIIGGGMVYTFAKAQGGSGVGRFVRMTIVITPGTLGKPKQRGGSAFANRCNYCR